MLDTIENFIDNIDNNKKRKFFPFILIIIWMLIIFFLSNMSGLESNIKSRTSLDTIIDNVLIFTNR